MRRIPATIGFFFAFAAAVAAPLVEAQPHSHLIIRVEEGDWGNVGRRDIETVLNSVADVLAPYFPQHAASRIWVSPSPQGPLVLLDRTANGSHHILLDVHDARWDQFTYQFAHELCHVFTNYGHREIGPGTVARDHQWFEETLCEATSLFALNRMASRWEEMAQRPERKRYAPAFRAYAQRRLDSAQRRLPVGDAVTNWFAANREALERDPYLRERNEVLAARLLPLLENTPGAFESLGYLNASASSPPESFAAYLASWYDCCPTRYRGFIVRVMSLLEGRGPGDRPLPS